MKKGLLVGLISIVLSFGLAACGADGKTPYIGENGNWWVGDTDLGVPAQGPQGEQGKDGKSVVSIAKTSTSGLVDIYTITFSDGTTSTFTVTNGESNSIENIALTDSSGLTDTYTITFTNGSTKTFTVTNGANGENLTITSIVLKSREGLIDTYVINYSDGSKFEFVVSNGADGLTPYIGDNGNWWIGDTDTGVLADWEKANNVPLTPVSSGLQYKTMTFDGRSGYFVTGWDIDEFDDDYFYAKYGDDFDNLIDEWEEQGMPLVIPNYIGSVPVIGIASNASLNFKRIILSRNTICIGEKAFYNCPHVEEIDFNGANIICIPQYCFAGTKLKKINLPSSVTHVLDYAFDGVKLRQLDLSTIKYIGNHAFDDAFLNYVYLKDTVEYVGNHAFDCTFVYLESESKPSNWGSISDSAFAIPTGVKNNGEYLYSITGNEVTIYQYLGNQKKLVVPPTIEGKPITTIGCGFNTYLGYETWDSGMTDAERFHAFKNLDGFITELIVGNNVERIDRFSLLNGNMFIYIEKTVEEIYVSDADGLIGFYYDCDVDDGAPFSLIVLEDSTTITFDYAGTPKTYDELLLVEEEYEMLFKKDIEYSDIYYENDTYYAKNGLGYDLIGYRNNYVSQIVIPDVVDGLPVKAIGKYAFDGVIVDKLTIGNNVNRIRSYAFAHTLGKVFIPNSVDIINAYGLYLESGSRIYTNASSKKDDWDTNWKSNYIEVVYSTSKADFDNL